MTTVGERIRLLRRAMRLSQEEFAEWLGEGIATIKRWESGETVPDDKTLRLIAHLFGVPYEWLKEEKGEARETRKELPQTERELVLWVVEKTMEVAEEAGVKLSPSEVFDVARIAFNRLSKDLRNNGLSEEEGKKRIKTIINFLKNASS